MATTPGLDTLPGYVSKKIGDSIDGVRAAFAAGMGDGHGGDTDAVMTGNVVVLTKDAFDDEGPDPYIYDMALDPPRIDDGRYARVCAEYAAIDNVVAFLRSTSPELAYVVARALRLPNVAAP